MKTSSRVAAVGVGYSTTGRNLGLGAWKLAIEASTAAMDDAGMVPSDIDAVSIVSGAAGPGDVGDILTSMDLGRALGIGPLDWHGASSNDMPYVGAALNGIAALRAGFAHTVLTVRVIERRRSSADLVRDMASLGEPVVVAGDMGYAAPFGFHVGGMLPSIGAMPARRHMDVFGTTEEHFGAHVVTQRHHASMNPDAIFRDPITIDDYLAARYIAKPVRLLDCDYPVDSASAVIFTTGGRARDWRRQPVWVEAAASAAVSSFSFEAVDMLESAPFHVARSLWERTDLRPSDVDTAHLYDGFTIIVFQWLEALGFCGRGEAGPFVAAGNTRLGSTLPVNSDGGACNVGRRHGANFCIEAIRQLRGDCGERQVPGAEVAVWTNSVGPSAGAVLMTADR